MKRLFGAKPKQGPPPPSLDDATKALDGRISALEEKIKTLDVEIVKAREQMKKAKPGTSIHNSLKQRALRYLKQRKMYESQRDQMMNQSFTLEQTNFTAQTMKDTMLQVSVLKEAKASMDTQLKAINISDIEELQDDLQDMFDTNNEIQDLLSRSYATPDGLDDDDLEAELMTLEADLDDDTVAETPSYLSAMSDPLADLPQIPTAQPISQPALEMKLK